MRRSLNNLKRWAARNRGDIWKIFIAAGGASLLWRAWDVLLRTPVEVVWGLLLIVALVAGRASARVERLARSVRRLFPRARRHAGLARSRGAELERIRSQPGSPLDSLVDLASYDDLMVAGMRFVVHLQGAKGPPPKVRNIVIGGHKPRCPKCRTPMSPEARLHANVDPITAYHCPACEADYGHELDWAELSERVRNVAFARFEKDSPSAQLRT